MSQPQTGSCTCTRWNASDCMAARYGYEHDEDRYELGEECECSCHEEYYDYLYEEGQL